MKLKTIEVNGSVFAELQDGKPIYVTDDNKTIPFDAPATRDTIARLNNEARLHREAKEEAEGKLKLFEGIEDPHKALKALETLKNLDDKRLIDAGEVEKVKSEAKAAFDEQIRAIESKYRPVTAERDALAGELKQERLSTAFNRSKFIQEKMAIPVDIAQARFGSNFEFEDGRIIAKGSDGNRVYSRARPGEVADFDEAMEILVDAYQHRDSILKGTGASGGGASGSGVAPNGKRMIARAQFDALPAADKARAAREMQVVD